mmetsp:Transcript_2762/g.6451  ORF Transcript_2762/g.6451 Transcript_2762/m.6451 type:complete len:114 (-) Transcript_2762:178-519(-)
MRRTVSSTGPPSLFRRCLEYLDMLRVAIYAILLTICSRRMYEDMWRNATSEAPEAKEKRIAANLDFTRMANRPIDVPEVRRKVQDAGLSIENIASHCKVPEVAKMLVEGFKAE